MSAAAMPLPTHGQLMERYGTQLSNVYDFIELLYTATPAIIIYTVIVLGKCVCSTEWEAHRLVY